MHQLSKDIPRLVSIGLSRDRRQLLQESLRGIFHNDYAMRYLVPLLDAVVDGHVGALDTVVPRGFDGLFLAALSDSIRERLKAPWHGRRLPVNADKGFDFLCLGCHEWGLIQTLNFLSRAACRPSRKLAMLTSIRSEGINLLEWIAYHRLAGVEHFFVYANDNEDDSDELLRTLERNGIITYIPNETVVRGVYQIQSKVFEHAIHFLPEIRDFEWVFFADPDEFLILQSGTEACGTITDYLDKVPASDSTGALVSGVCWNWKWFNNEAVLKRSDQLNFERFKRSKPDRHVKTVARFRDVVGFGLSHKPRVMGGSILVNPVFQPVDLNSVGADPEYSVGQLNHYWSRSFEEFAAKHARGRGDRDFSQFFVWGNQFMGTPDEVPEALIVRVRGEIERLINLDGVELAHEIVRRAFDRWVCDANSRLNIGQLFEETKTASTIKTV